MLSTWLSFFVCFFLSSSAHFLMPCLIDILLEQNEASNKTEQVPSSAKKKRFFGKLFSGKVYTGIIQQYHKTTISKDVLNQLKMIVQEAL